MQSTGDLSLALIPAMLTLRLIRPLRFSPTPARHRLGIIHGIFGQLGINNSNACPPFQVPNQRRPEFRIGRDPNFIGRIQQQLDPPLPLLIIQHLSDVVTDHNGMAATILPRIFFGTAKDFRNKMRDMPRMIRRHIPKYRTNELVFENLIIKGAEKMLDRLFAPGPFIKRWCGHIRQFYPRNLAKTAHSY